MDYEEIYDFLEKQDRLVRCELFYELVMRKENSLLHMEDTLDDYLLCKALAACYELQDYLANCIAKERELRDGGDDGYGENDRYWGDDEYWENHEYWE